jgi:hypothetical protein
MQLLNPAVLKAHANAGWSSFKVWGGKEIKAGKITPFFLGCAMVGTVGYTMEYTFVGRYHVMDKQALVAKAMEHAHH